MKDSKRRSCKPEGIALTMQIPAFKGNPAKVLFTSVTQQGSLELLAGLGILAGNGIDGARMQSEQLTATDHQGVQIKVARPFQVPAQGMLLGIVTEVPDKVDFPCLCIQQAQTRFHTVAIRQLHASILPKVSESVQKRALRAQRSASPP